MADLPIGNVPISTLDDADNILFAEGPAPKKQTYGSMKADIIGSAALLTNADKPKEAINELVQDLLDSVGYGVISGGVVSAQSTPNMTVQVTACTYKTNTGARKTATANTSLAVTTADTTNPRVDIVYINSIGVISYLQGTAAATPVAPTTPTGGFLIAQINVSANASSVTNSNIVDMRKILISTDYLNTQLSEKANKDGTMQTNLNADMVDGIQGVQIPLKSTIDTTYYINPSTGVDTNDGLTSGTAFKTIQHAIDILPQVINHAIAINVASGTYNESISVKGFYGNGYIDINGDSTVSSNRIINSINFSNNGCIITFTGFRLSTTSTAAITVNNCINASIFYCNIIDSASQYGIYFGNSLGKIGNTTISNRSEGIHITNCSTVFSSTNSGTGNVVGLSATEGSTIGKYSTQPSGTTTESTGGGGVIR